MTSQAYDPFIKTMLGPGHASNGHSGASINILDDTIGVALVDTNGGYTVNDEHDLIADLGANIVSSGQQTISSIAYHEPAAGGVAIDGADTTLSGVGDGTETVDALVIYDDSITGDALMVYIDQGTGFGFLPNNSTVEIAWDSGDNRIFSVGV